MRTKPREISFEIVEDSLRKCSVPGCLRTGHIRRATRIPITEKNFTVNDKIRHHFFCHEHDPR